MKAPELVAFSAEVDGDDPVVAAGGGSFGYAIDGAREVRAPSGIVERTNGNASPATGGSTGT